MPKLRSTVPRWSALMLTLLLPAGCAVLEPEVPVQAHELSPDLSGVERARPTGLTLFVSPVKAGAPYATSQMAYRERPYEVSYFAQNAWAAEPSRLLEPWLMAALEATSAFDSVVAGPSAPPTHLRVDTDIVVLRHEFDTEPSQVRLQLRMVVIDAANRTVLGTRVFEATVPARSRDAYGGVIATNRALHILLGEATSFVVETVGRM